MSDIEVLVESARNGSRPALARLLSLAERGGAPVFELEDCLQPLVGNAWTVGITGPPGAGKSTLINALLPVARDAVARAAVLAVDPSSPFSNGAILGDRVRMRGGELGESVFIRSMASRGDVGGLARAASTCIRVFDAARWPVVLVETLGIGQVELDIMDLADTVIVVLNPGWGDTFQANKAGLTEAGDIFVINKADRPGTEQTKKDLQNSLALLDKNPQPVILETVATEPSGVNQLWAAINQHKHRLESSGQVEAARQAKRLRIVHKTIKQQANRALDEVLASEQAAALVRGLTLGQLDMQSTVSQVINLLTKPRIHS